VYGTSPDMHHIWSAFGLAFCLMLLGLFLFRRASAEMVDAL